MTINSWPKGERPRERLLTHGAQILSNAELLAIFLRTGIKGKTAIDLARELLTTFGSLDKILESDFKSFNRIKGMGVAKYCQLQATLELVKRHVNCKISETSCFSNQEVAGKFLLNNFPIHKNETFACMFLDNKNQLLKFEELFKGTINSAQVYPRVIAQKCLHYNAAAIILSHNHPSGCLQPSQSDQHITQKIITTLDLIDVKVLDHFIIGKNQVHSMSQHGNM